MTKNSYLIKTALIVIWVLLSAANHPVHALEGTQDWAFEALASVDSSPAIDADGTIYVGSDDGNLYAINPNGTQKWAFTTGAVVESSPAIDTDGTIYVGSMNGNLYAINPNGTQKWVFPTGDQEVESSPAIGSDGTIYVGTIDYQSAPGTSDSGNLFAVNPNGTQKWVFPVADWVQSSPAIGADGTIYVGSNDDNLYAVNPSGTQKWVFPTGNSVESSPVIGTDGTLYLGSGDGKLYAVNPNGSQKWTFTTGDDVQSSPAIGTDGTIYVGSRDGNLYAVNPNGTQKWAFVTGDRVDSSPALAADGTVYVGSEDNNLYAINPDGSQKWAFATGNSVDSSPAIASDGTVYIGSSDDRLYAIDSDSGGLASSPWPMFHRDVKHTGNVAKASRRAEIIVTWSNGIWYWDGTKLPANPWEQMTPDVGAKDIAAGDFTGDGIADVASTWDGFGLYYQDGANLNDWVKIDDSPPMRVTAGDITGDGRDEIIGTWENGIWYWDGTKLPANRWTQMTADVGAKDIAAGDFNGDGFADVASTWDDYGLWYQNGANLDDWVKIDNSPPMSVAAGDITDDDQDEIIGTWFTGNAAYDGIWYYNVGPAIWTRMTADVGAKDIAAGDFNGDGFADVASTWDDYGLWYQNGANLDDWVKIDNAPPMSVTAGDVTGQ